MTLVARNHPKPLKGRERPRIAPPVPAKHDLPSLRETAEGMGLTLMPWQEYAGRFLTATGPDGLLLFKEVCIVVARQNGKTTLMKPYIIRALRQGKKVLHIANQRELPRQMFGIIAGELDESLFMKRRGKGGKMHTVWPRHGAGSEEILLANGGWYRIAAASTGAARGHDCDIVIIDETREMESDEVIKAAAPTLLMSSDPQMIYLSNAGTDKSVVLNDVRQRREEDPALAYLEWSAAPERSVDDRAGWAESNPALGHFPQVQPYLERTFESYRMAGKLATFETEHLCRWVATTRELLVDPHTWSQCAGEAETPRAPTMAVSMDPDRRRASAAIAWIGDDGTHLQLLFDVTGDPIDTDALGQDLRTTAGKLGIRRVGYDPLTDRELVKYFKKAESISGGMFANATSTFTNVVSAKTLRWHDADPVTDDLGWTARKLVDKDTGAFEAVRAQDDRPITASLAAIRAVYLATGLRLATPRVM